MPKGAVLTHNRKHFRNLHNAGHPHSGIIICTEDRDAEALADRIQAAIADEGELAGKLIRIVRPGPCWPEAEGRYPTRSPARPLDRVVSGMSLGPAFERMVRDDSGIKPLREAAEEDDGSDHADAQGRCDGLR